jgi:thioredoxin reductase (NADPH)
MLDVIIIGGGPAGLSSAIYCARSGLNVLLLEKSYIGGQMAIAASMENYPGFEVPINGLDLSIHMEKQAKKFGTQILNEEVIEVDLKNHIKIVKTKTSIFESKTIILCLGAFPRKLELPKEEGFRGLGVSYCAICDGAFFKDKIVAVVGGGNTAVEDAIYLSKLCHKVFLIHRGHTLTATKVLQRELFNNIVKIEFVRNSAVVNIIGDDSFEGIDIQNIKTNEITKLQTQALFVAIGNLPNTTLVEGKVLLNESSYIITDDKMQTNVSGVFAAGDIREKVLRQVITASSDGAIAAYMAEKFINNSGG